MTIRESLETFLQTIARGERPKVGDAILFTERGWEFSRANLIRLREEAHGTFTVTIRDHVMLIDASVGDSTWNLPPASSAQWRAFTFKRLDSSANTVTISPDGSDTIDGSGSYDVANQYDAVTIISDGTEWWILSTG